MHAESFHRRGMTLVELLVVVAIIGLLVITVVPNVASTQENRQAREAARTVSSFIAKAHARAIGRTAWSGFMLVPLASGTAVVDLHLADCPDPYRGDNTTSTLMIMPPASPTARTGTNQTIGTGTNVVSGNGGDVIRFGGQGPFYLVTSVSNRFVNFMLRGDAGQTPDNTPWPAVGVPYPFEIFPKPTTAGSPVTLAGNRAIDLRWSGFGNSSNYQRFASGTVTILFDGAGRLRQRVQGTRFDLADPVFLLIGRIDRVGNPSATLVPTNDTVGANFQYPDSFWIGIDPRTGAVRTAECKPGMTTDVESQEWIRQALAGGQ